MGVFCCCCFSNPSQFRDQFSLLTSFLHVTSILSVYYLSVQQLPYLLSIKSILKDYWGTNPKFCCILHFYCLSTIFHSFIYPLFWLVPDNTTLFIIASLWKWVYYTVLCHSACLAGSTMFQIFCWGFSKADPEHQEHSKNIKHDGAFFILFYSMLSQTTLLFFFNRVTRQYPEDLPAASRKATQISNDSCWWNNKASW